jgi:fatty acid desaturase
LLSLTIALLSDLLWRAEAKAGKILLTAIALIALLIAIWVAQVGSAEQTDPLVPWIAILSATLLLKWLHTMFRETDGQ